MAIMMDGGPEGLLYDDKAAPAFGKSKGNYDFDNKVRVDDNVEDFNWVVSDAEASTMDGSPYHIVVYEKFVVVPSIHTNLPDGEYAGEMLELKWAWCEPANYRINNGRGYQNLKHWTVTDVIHKIPSYCPHHRILVIKEKYSKQINRDKAITQVLS